jgi:transposase-like protein
VELCQHGDRSVGQFARDFDLTEAAVREWVKQAERDTGIREDKPGRGLDPQLRVHAICPAWRRSSGRRHDRLVTSTHLRYDL